MRRTAPLRPLVLTCLFSVGVALASAGCAGVQIARADLEHPGQLLFNGHVKEEVNCFKCHNGDATGSMRGPSLDVTAEMSDDDILEYINEGEGIMPAFADKLTSDEKAQIVSWLRVRFPPSSAAVNQ